MVKESKRVMKKQGKTNEIAYLQQDSEDDSKKINNYYALIIPENEAEARMYIVGLVPYVRDTQDRNSLEPSRPRH
jgi:enterochelin esterase-like enzyme